jgi:HlyD family secretion protein
MAIRPLYLLSALGLSVAVYSAYVFAEQPPPLPPVFNPAANPYSDGIHANGMIESLQSQGENINIYPEVPGPVTRVLVHEGSAVHKGDPLLTIDASVQSATMEQQKAQMEAAATALAELKAQPRPETLQVAAAQVDNAKATLKNAQDQLAKQEQSYAMDPKSVSMNDLDNARNAAKVAETALEVTQRQYDLTKAGAWIYDIQNQERQLASLTKAYESAKALLDKYAIKAPVDGVVLSIAATAGSYVSTQGAYDSYTQGFGPLIVMGTPQDELAVRSYVDEILVHRLPDPANIRAQMFIQGTDIRIPLTFERIQPYVSPKIELSDQREERVDVRVLPMIFRFRKPANLKLYPGQLVDVYIGSGTPARLSAESVQGARQ